MLAKIFMFILLTSIFLRISQARSDLNIYTPLLEKADEIAEKGKEKLSRIWDKIGDHLKDIKDEFDEWNVNQNVCPPVLCGPVLDSQIQGEPSQIAFEPGAPYPFFEGDIILDNELKRQLAHSGSGKKRSSRQRDSRAKRAIVKPLRRLWKYGVLPYEIDQSLDDEMQSLIHRAHRHIERRTCVHFIPRARRDDDYLFYINQPGCWSYVGRTGGSQMISLGYGCNNLGTVIHETCHAIGFWHEQSRSDRDKYIEVLLDNVSRVGKQQFGKRKKRESYSKGYSYDYESIMHYGGKYFSSNGKSTLETKGIGKKLDLKIGQRHGLSDIDVAQLRDVYYCNTKEQNDRVCGKGWEPYDGNCYKFVSEDLQQLSGARDACSILGAQLLTVNNKNEDNYIKQTLQEKFEYFPTWRTGGRKIDGKFQWEDPKGKRNRPMKYTAWHDGHPDSYSTLILDVRDSQNRTRVWKATWSGSKEKPDLFAYPYICERKDYACDRGWINWGDRCYKFYIDKRQFDRAHQKCVSQNSHLLHINSEHEDIFIKNYLITTHPSSSNWRTGGKKKKGKSKMYWYDKEDRYKRMKYKDWAPNQPGKNTTMILTRYDGTPRRFVWKSARPGDPGAGASDAFSYICEKDATVNCYHSTTKDGRDYRGELSYTEQGITCQAWSSQYPQKHDYLTGRIRQDQQEGLGDHNYCRNPRGRRARPWCYVPLTKTKWQYCDVSICDS